MGMANFYRRHTPNFSQIALPLQELLTKYNSVLKQFKMTEEATAAVENLKKALASATTLAHYNPTSTTFQLVVDASAKAIGGALHQKSGDSFVPIGFFSKKLSAMQAAYSTFDRELLAAYLTTVHFKSIIEGQSVFLVSDHKPLVSAFKSKTEAKSDRQQRHLSFLSEYITQMDHIKGSENIVADALSRGINQIESHFVDLQEIARHQSDDKEVEEHKPFLKQYPMHDAILWCDTNTQTPRPFRPVSVRKQVFNQLHGLSHPGVKGTTRLIKERFMWPKMDKSIKQWCQECQSCQQSKIHKHIRQPVDKFQLPVFSRFQIVHIDLVGPLPCCDQSNYRYLLTMMDRATRWIEAIPLSEISAENVAKAFVTSWICRFGVPLYIITDRGSQFESELFHHLSSLIGFHRLRSTAYHPQINGLIEHAYKTIKTALTCRGGKWTEHLPFVLLGLRTIPNDNCVSPFAAVTGQSLLVPNATQSPHSVRTSVEYIQNLSKMM